MGNNSIYDNEMPESSDRHALYYIPNQNRGFGVDSGDCVLEPTINDVKYCQNDLSNQV